MRFTNSQGWLVILNGPSLLERTNNNNQCDVAVVLFASVTTILLGTVTDAIVMHVRSDHSLNQ